HLVVGGGGNRTAGDEVAITHLVLRGLAREGACGRDRLCLCAPRELQIHGIDAHERLPTSDGLPRIHQALEHFPRDSESQITLHATGGVPREWGSRLEVALDVFDPYQRRLCTRIGR